MSTNSSGSDFFVNTFVSGQQLNPDLAIDPLGNFVITWQSAWQDGDGFGIFARAYDAAATSLGSEFQVNTVTASDQIDPAIGVDSNGNVVIVWASDQNGTQGIYGQRFNATGQALGAEFQVNPNVLGDQSNPDVAVDAVGNFVVVYDSEQQDINTSGQDNSGTGVFGQRYNTFGAPVGPAFRVNTFVDQDQYDPAVATNSSGSFVVVWVSQGQDRSGTGIFGQRYSNVGVPLGSEFQINSDPSGSQINPSVAMDENGGFVVAWQSDGSGGQSGSHVDNDGYGVYARQYVPNGSPVGQQLLVNRTTRGDQIEPSVALDASGNFTVVWASERGDSDGYGILGQQFSTSGNRVGSEFRVNGQQNGDQTQPVVGITPTSNSVVAWQSNDAGLEDIVASATTLQNEIRGTREADTLDGTPENDRILGLQGSDILRGLGNDDVLEGGQGDDDLQGGSGDDLILGGANNDTLDGGDKGNDTLTGNAGTDTFVLRNKRGNTFITDFEDGTDVLGLSTGINTRNLRFEADGNNTIIRWQGIRLATLLGTSVDEISVDDFQPVSQSGRTIRGNNQDNVLTGTSGNDTIDGRGGNDEISGLGGDDALTGGSGNDQVTGGAGVDTLEGNGGSDTLTGGDGGDILTGGNGNDQMTGGKGGDTLTGGNGNDQVTGGGGADFFTLEDKNGVTTITDFRNGTDLLVLGDGLDFAGLSIVQRGVDTSIRWNGQQIAILKNVTASDITTPPSDFA
jgi:Ca2+-binding RTX toxin-like protein